MINFNSVCSLDCGYVKAPGSLCVGCALLVNHFIIYMFDGDLKLSVGASY